jgi:hypothetical protein
VPPLPVPRLPVPPLIPAWPARRAPPLVSPPRLAQDPLVRASLAVLPSPLMRDRPVLAVRLGLRSPLILLAALPLRVLGRLVWPPLVRAPLAPGLPLPPPRRARSPVSPASPLRLGTTPPGFPVRPAPPMPTSPQIRASRPPPPVVLGRAVRHRQAGPRRRPSARVSRSRPPARRVRPGGLRPRVVLPFLA